jgi:hypothetical protein
VKIHFDGLKFEDHFAIEGCFQAKAFFANGYGVSVVRGKYTYGADAGLYELAVLKGSEDDFDICCDTPITSDVEGWCSPERVTELMRAVASLPKAEGAQ